MDTKNRITITGELVKKEFIEEKVDGKKHRAVNFYVRYGPSQEIIFSGYYNEKNSQGEDSRLYTHAKEAFNKYKAYVSKVAKGRDSENKIKWEETTSDKADRVKCQGEYVPREWPYKDNQSDKIEIGLSKAYRLNGLYGILHADPESENSSRFVMEIVISDIIKNSSADDNLTLMIKGWGIKEGFGDTKDYIYPITLKVPSLGVDHIQELFEDYNFTKDGVSAIFTGKVYVGQEVYGEEEDFEGNKNYLTRSINELRITNKITDPKKSIFAYCDDNERAISPEKIREMIKDREKKHAEMIKEFERGGSSSRNNKQNDNRNNDDNKDDDIPF